MNPSPRFHLNDQEKTMIYKIIFHGLIGVLLTLIPEVFVKVDYGAYTPIVTVALSTLSLTLTQFTSGPSCQISQPVVSTQTMNPVAGQSAQLTEQPAQPNNP